MNISVTMASGKYTAAKNAVPPLPHNVSHNIGLTPSTNLSSRRKDNWKVTYLSMGAAVCPEALM
jgi:hypothetical protein